MAARRWCWARCRRAPATRRLRCSRMATSIIWSRPTRSAWGSTSTSITSPLPPTANMTAISSGGSIRPNSRRSPAAPAAHAELVTTLFEFLMKKGRIPDAWFVAQVEQADRVDGDIDTLSGRIAQIRTWTFVANRPDWLADPEHWQGITREVENKLSDALHERLTERFVDRRTSVLMRRLRGNSVLNTEIGKTGEVTVDGHVNSPLYGFTVR